jgi:hypothetical protein
MKKLLVLLLFFVLVSPFYGNQEASAVCKPGPFSQALDDKTTIDADNSLLEGDDETVSILCAGGGTPQGWVNLKNSAKPIPGKNYKQYEKKGNATTALNDLNKLVAKAHEPPISYGSGKWAVKTNNGTIMMYPVDKTNGKPAIKWNVGGEVVRYK